MKDTIVILQWDDPPHKKEKTVDLTSLKIIYPNDKIMKIFISPTGVVIRSGLDTLNITPDSYNSVFVDLKDSNPQEEES